MSTAALARVLDLAARRPLKMAAAILSRVRTRRAWVKQGSQPLWSSGPGSRQW